MGENAHLADVDASIKRDLNNAANVIQAKTEELSTQYETVINKLIDTEVSNFDKKFVREIGYERAKSSNGDHQIISKALDSLYNTFLNDIKVIEEKKERLTTRIREQEKIYLAHLENDLNLLLNQLDRNLEIEKNNINDDINFEESSLTKNQLEQQSIAKNAIPNIEEKIEELRDLKALKEQEKRPPVKNLWKKAVYIALSLLLLVYIILFYSSGIYLMTSGLEKAQQYIKIEEFDKLNQFSVFYAPALSTAYLDNGFVNLIYLLLGSFMIMLIPVVFGVGSEESVEINTSLNLQKLNRFQRIMRDRSFRSISFIFITIAIDFLIAFKITVILKKIELLTVVKAANHEITFWDISRDSNFWSVLLLGSLALIVFHFLIRKLTSLFRLSDIQHIEYRKNVEIQQIGDKIKLLNDEKMSKEELLITLQKENVEVVNRLAIKKEKAQLLPKIYTSNRFGVESQNKTESRKIIDLTQIYTNLVQNEKITPSKTSLADRFNCFFEGWVDLLHQEFSVQKAEIKTQDARDIINNWERVENIQLKQLN